jgi:hypothetical protein
MEIMNTCDVKFDNNFIIQCVLNNFWDGSDVILKRCNPRIMCENKLLENGCSLIGEECAGLRYSLYNLWNRKIKMYYCNFDATTDIVGVITDFKFYKCSKKVQIINFVKKMNKDPIIVYENLKGKRENYYFTCLEQMKNFYNIQMKIKPIGKYITSWYGSSAEIGHVIVYHKQQNKYVFDNKVGKIEDNQIRRWGFFSPRGDDVVKFAFHITIKDNTCDDYYCALKEMNYINHFHASFASKYPDCLDVIEYSDVPELSKYTKFFSK